MRELEHKLEENKIKRGEEEKELQKAVDILRSKYLKLDTEKNHEENEIIETRKEIDKIKLDIMQVVYFFVKMFYLYFKFILFLAQCRIK